MDITWKILCIGNEWIERCILLLLSWKSLVDDLVESPPELRDVVVVVAGLGKCWWQY